MQSWDIIINTALMGTDKKQVGTTDILPGLEAAAAIIQENQSKDKEEKFLQLASVVFNYRQCGALPGGKEIIMPLASVEEKLYCNVSAIQVLKDIFSEDSIPLLKFWLQHCYNKQHVGVPEVGPS